MVAAIQKLRGLFNRDLGGSYSNEYKVNIQFDPDKNSALLATLKEVGIASFGSETAFGNMMFLCDEASLPGQYAATQELDGLYTGRLIQYPHAKLYNDLMLSFIMTNQETALKFFEGWFYAMFPEKDLNTGETISYDQKLNQRAKRTNVTALRYYDNIVCDNITVTKFHKTNTAPDGQVTSRHIMYKAYPYSVESVPLAYGASTLNKLRVQFRYEKHIQTF